MRIFLIGGETSIILILMTFSKLILANIISTKRHWTRSYIIVTDIKKEASYESRDNEFQYFKIHYMLGKYHFVNSVLGR